MYMCVSVSVCVSVHVCEGPASAVQIWNQCETVFPPSLGCADLTMCLMHSGIGSLCPLVPVLYSMVCRMLYNTNLFCAALHSAYLSGLAVFFITRLECL